MRKTAYPNYAPALGYMTEKIRHKYITKAIECNILPFEAHRIAQIISLYAPNDPAKPIQFWQLYSILGERKIISIVHRFYTKVYQDEPWFSSVFKRIGDLNHHVNTQSSMWLDVMGGGLTYHGAEFRLNFHHQHNAFELMNEKGAKRWMDLMLETLSESDAYMTDYVRVRISINTFLTYFMDKYAADFGFENKAIFGPTNLPIHRKINFLNMTDTAIEALSETQLRQSLAGRRGISINEHTHKKELIQMAKNL